MERGQPPRRLAGAVLGLLALAGGAGLPRPAAASPQGASSCASPQAYHGPAGAGAGGFGVVVAGGGGGPVAAGEAFQLAVGGGGRRFKGFLVKLGGGATVVQAAATPAAEVKFKACPGLALEQALTHASSVEKDWVNLTVAAPAAAATVDVDVAVVVHSSEWYRLSASVPVGPGSAPAPEPSPEPAPEPVPRDAPPPPPPPEGRTADCPPSAFLACAYRVDPQEEVYFHFDPPDPAGVDVAISVRGQEEVGYLALSFPEGRAMVPAKAVIGWAGGGGHVGFYSLEGYSVRGVVPRDAGGAVTGMAVEERAGTTVVKFRVALGEQHGAGLQLDPAAVVMHWAFLEGGGGRPPGLGHHSRRGSFKFNLNEGTGATVEGGGSAGLFIAHGALNLLAWCVLVPLATLATLFDDQSRGGKSPKWFQVHWWLNHAAVASTVVAAALSLSVAKRPYSTHGLMGLAAVAAVVVQYLLGTFRPGPGAAARRAWALLHLSLGVGLLVLAVACVVTGPLQDRAPGTPAPWLATAAAALALSALLARTTVRSRVRGAAAANSTKGDISVPMGGMATNRDSFNAGGAGRASS